MEKLFAYALLMCEGYDVWDQYSEELDRLFLDDPQNEIYLYLEEVTDRKTAVLRILSEMDKVSYDIEILGQELMKLISDVYQKSSLKDFAKHMYFLWTKLPDKMQENEPFFTLSYADECLLYNDEKQCRELYERAIYYFD